MMCSSSHSLNQPRFSGNRDTGGGVGVRNQALNLSRAMWSLPHMVSILSSANGMHVDLFFSVFSSPGAKSLESFCFPPRVGVDKEVKSFLVLVCLVFSGLIWEFPFRVGGWEVGVHGNCLVDLGWAGPGDGVHGWLVCILFTYSFLLFPSMECSCCPFSRSGCGVETWLYSE